MTTTTMNGTNGTHPTAASTESALRQRERALQRSAVNARIWGLIRGARQLRDDILELTHGTDNGTDPARAAIERAGLPIPAACRADFSTGTFDLTMEKLGAIAEEIAEQLGLAIGEMPPPPDDILPAEGLHHHEVVNGQPSKSQEQQDEDVFLVGRVTQADFERLLDVKLDGGYSRRKAFEADSPREQRAYRETVGRQAALRSSPLVPELHTAAVLANALAPVLRRIVGCHRPSEGRRVMQELGLRVPCSDDDEKAWRGDNFEDAWHSALKAISAIRRFRVTTREALDRLIEHPERTTVRIVRR